MDTLISLIMITAVGFVLLIFYKKQRLTKPSPGKFEEVMKTTGHSKEEINDKSDIFDTFFGGRTNKNSSKRDNVKDPFKIFNEEQKKQEN